MKLAPVPPTSLPAIRKAFLCLKKEGPLSKDDLWDLTSLPVAQAVDGLNRGYLQQLPSGKWRAASRSYYERRQALYQEPEPPTLTNVVRIDPLEQSEVDDTNVDLALPSGFRIAAYCVLCVIGGMMVGAGLAL